MKLIEAMKKEKDLLRKAEDYRKKIATYSAHLNFETPMYADQAGQVKEWLQGHFNILKEISKLRLAIQRTNLQTQVTIEIGQTQVTKCISEWIYTRRDLSELNRKAWAALTDKNLQEGKTRNSSGEITEVKIIRCYDSRERDVAIEILSSEKSLIDSRLEVVNAVTDLIE